MAVQPAQPYAFIQFIKFRGDPDDTSPESLLYCWTIQRKFAEPQDTNEAGEFYSRRCQTLYDEVKEGVSGQSARDYTTMLLTDDDEAKMAFDTTNLPASNFRWASPLGVLSVHGHEASYSSLSQAVHTWDQKDFMAQITQAPVWAIGISNDGSLWCKEPVATVFSKLEGRQYITRRLETQQTSSIDQKPLQPHSNEEHLNAEWAKLSWGPADGADDRDTAGL